MLIRRVACVLGGCAALALVAFACNTNGTGSSLIGGLVPTGNQVDEQRVSQGRLNAARQLAGVNEIYVDIVQFDPTVLTESRCFPLGDGLAITPWASTIGGPVPNLNPDFATGFEYDLLTTIGETEYILSIRAINPDSDPNFTSLEFNFRAVNPWKNPHSPGNDYFLGQADFPSNDDMAANRSLIDLTGGDFAVIVRGVSFNGLPGNTRAFMNFLGPQAWVLFMRDNALQSGRFYNIAGALTGAPAAFEDDPSIPNGFFKSVQVNGDNFDALDEQFSALDPAAFRACAALVPPGGPGETSPGSGVTAQYAFLDISNFNADGTPGPGKGGFILVVRDDAFQDPIGSPEDVVLDPSGGADPLLPPANANLIPAPPSGYNEPGVPGITSPDEDDFGPGMPGHGPPGVHEIGVSVFFIHS